MESGRCSEYSHARTAKQLQDCYGVIYENQAIYTHRRHTHVTAHISRHMHTYSISESTTAAEMPELRPVESATPKTHVLGTTRDFAAGAAELLASELKHIHASTDYRL